MSRIVKISVVTILMVLVSISFVQAEEAGGIPKQITELWTAITSLGDRLTSSSDQLNQKIEQQQKEIQDLKTAVSELNNKLGSINNNKQTIDYTIYSRKQYQRYDYENKQYIIDRYKLKSVKGTFEDPFGKTYQFDTSENSECTIKLPVGFYKLSLESTSESPSLYPSYTMVWVDDLTNGIVIFFNQDYEYNFWNIDIKNFTNIGTNEYEKLVNCIPN